MVSFRPKAYDHVHLRVDKGALTGKVGVVSCSSEWVWSHAVVSGRGLMQ